MVWAWRFFAVDPPRVGDAVVALAGDLDLEALLQGGAGTASAADLESRDVHPLVTIAALLAHGRHAEALKLTVIDAAPRPRFDPDDDIALRVSAIATGSADILESIGAWEAVVSRSA